MEISIAQYIYFHDKDVSFISELGGEPPYFI